jgi:hypothetical protein
MTQAPDIRFIGMEPSGALASVARDRAEALDRVHRGIMSCHIAIGQERRRGGQDGSFSVRVDLITLPGHKLTVNRMAGDDVYTLLHDAFERTRHQLEEAANRTWPQ